MCNGDNKKVGIVPRSICERHFGKYLRLNVKKDKGTYK